jgi:O-antigen ligase
VPLGVVAAAAILMMRSPSDVVNSAPHGGFFDYPNTRAAFFVLAAASALTIGVLWRSLSIRIAAFGAAAIFGAVPFLTQTRAAMLVVIGVGVLALGFGGRRAARPAVAIVATVFLLAVAGTTVLAATYEQGGNGRVHLWHGAFNLMVKHPVTGVGPRRFAVASPAARADVDSRHMPDEFLLQGAETGVVGMVLLILLFLWGFARLFFARTSDGAVAIAAAALAGVGMHASVDYVLHLSAVPIITAGLIGSAVSGRRRVGVDRAS